MTTVGQAYAAEARARREKWFRKQQNSRWNKCMGTVPESIDEYYGPQPKYDYTWKGLPILDSIKYDRSFYVLYEG